MLYGKDLDKCNLSSYYYFFGHDTHKILVPPTGIKPTPIALEVENLNH